jgi:hypothetical protein
MVPSSPPPPRHQRSLSIAVPVDRTIVSTSQFSPETPPPRLSREKPSHDQPPPTTDGFRDRITNFFNMWTFSKKGPDLLPTQQPHEFSEEWRRCPCANCQNVGKRRKRRIWAIVALIIVLLFLVSNVIALNIRIFSAGIPDAPSASSSAKPSTKEPSTLTADTQQCISQFTLNAPANPSSYPCPSCLPLLQGIPAAFPFSNPQDGQTVQDAIQFCGLKSVFNLANPDGQNLLTSKGWFRDLQFCTWRGLTCDGSGRVSSL